MRHPFAPPVIRLSPRTRDPAAITGPRTRPRGSRRPHTDATVEAVRRLIEDTALTYGEIAAKTGVGRASICRWTRDQRWVRHVFAPRATDTVPRPRAGQKLKLRLLAERLRSLAERYTRELEASASVDPDKLMAALQVLKMAQLEAMGRRRRRKWEPRTETGSDFLAREQAIKTALKEMRRGGVDLDRTPQEALDLLIDARMPPEDHPALRPRGRWRR